MGPIPFYPVEIPTDALYAFFNAGYRVCAFLPKIISKTNSFKSGQKQIPLTQYFKLI
jgi:hypothetical protein